MDESDQEGDPTGRRIAAKHAQLLAEAGRVSRALELMMERAGLDRRAAADLTGVILEAERSELLRSAGHIESRKRFKGGPVRPVAPPDRCLLFMDESGKSVPSASDYFALGGVALTGAEAERYRSRADELKDRFWGHHGVTFHEPHMRRHDGDFYFDGDPAKQAAFDAAVNQLIDETDFVVFGAALRKSEFRAFIDAGTDPYLSPDLYATTLQMLLERYVDYRAMTSTERTRSKVILEAQGPKEDATHQHDYADILLNGTQWVPESAFQQWLEAGILFPVKSGSDPMELADMVSRDIYEWIEGGCRTFPGRWAALSARIYCRDDRRRGKFGVKVFPDADIRAAIEAHRATSGPAK